MIWETSFPTVTDRVCIRWLSEVGRLPWCAIHPLLEWGSEREWSEVQAVLRGDVEVEDSLKESWEASGWTIVRRQRFLVWLQRHVSELSVSDVAEWIAAQKEVWPWYVPTDPEYPARWRELEDPPPVVWCSQDLAAWQARSSPRSLAVVGSRRQSPYGRLATQDFVRTSVENYQATIVSGAAYGVDMTAHLSCLRSGGKTIAVLPQGCAQIPTRLTALLAEPNCLAVTEYPPHTAVKRWHYAQRNRLISGWAEAVLVVEATKQSGTFLTAAAAFTQGKEVFVITQPRHHAQAEGVCQLVENGAHLVCDPHQMWKEIAVSSASQQSLFSGVLPLHNRSAQSLLALFARASTELEKAIIRFVWEHDGQCFASECRAAVAEKLAATSEWARAVYTLELKGIIRQELGLLHLQGDV
ncbi:DNA-processing protein DprA [Candidatus Woesebacteria bacterium]|nr:DNA-processing protein DprA [Candidatus Woesebacteria bacterium]MCD8507306.1 DNA-processing protein DprA [Candidatus Woesebacteria bacterium]MCD8527007.1 DNA-processing protein DprA [Candidatus Woesebacteria bacterium]MCD8546754.1 DNA-processing protein DprA [Candidatus Woesebacteria bacterium]